MLFGNGTYAGTIAPDAYVWRSDEQYTIASLTVSGHGVKSG